ncbi:hypothetical protein G5I_00880 [Acromyrmex echinatior]|uniref:Uncharacterized protein n=1 Tax=Acromyrmex echinatior TaxID=103372 RepID=F4W6P7_ACREC|nr:hypothetical protein G5I_00880 [Acromyrmex echinatior]
MRRTLPPYNIFATFSQAPTVPDEDVRPLLKSKDALATFVSTLDKAGWLSMKGKSLFHVPEEIDRRCIVFDAIRVIIYHYPANVYPRHLMGHQTGPRYSTSHSGRRKIGANFRYIVGQLYEREKDLSPMFRDKLWLIRFTKTAEMAGGKNEQRQEGRRKSNGKEEEEEEEEEDDNDDEESSCSRIAYQSVSPKATEPLILIIGYNLVAANSCQSDKCTAINSIWKCGAQQTANSQIKKRVFLSKWERLYWSELTKADLRTDIHFTSEPLLLVPPLIVFCPSLLISRGLDVSDQRRPTPTDPDRLTEHKDPSFQSKPCVLPSPFAATVDAEALAREEEELSLLAKEMLAHE